MQRAKDLPRRNQPPKCGGLAAIRGIDGIVGNGRRCISKLLEQLVDFGGFMRHVGFERLDTVRVDDSQRRERV